MTRSFRVFIEIVLAAIFLVGLAVGGLLLRVSQSPLHIDNYIPELQALTQGLLPNLNLQTNNAVLDSGKADEAFEIVLHDVTLRNNENEKVGSVQAMALGFSWRNLLMLSLTPSTILIKGPSVQFTRFEDGHIGFSSQEEKQARRLSIDTIAQVLAAAPAAFHEVRISDAWVQFEDKKNPLKLEAKNGTINLVRNGHEINGTLKVDLSTEGFHQTLKGSILYDAQHHLTRVTFGVHDIALTELSGVLMQIPSGLSISTPVSAIAEITLDRAFQPLTFRLDLKGQKGEMQYPPYFPTALALDHFNLHTIYNVLDDSLTLEQLRMASGATQAEARGLITHLRDATADKTITLSAKTTNVPIDKLDEYWPHQVGEDARLWVTQHLRSGIADNATLQLKGLLKADKNFSIAELGGTIGFHGITVDYLPPMEPVKEAHGVATYDADSFNIQTDNGTILKTHVPAGDIRISNLRHGQPRIDMLFDLKGPFSDTIEVIAAKPLEFPQSMSLTPAQFTSGNAESKLYLGFPLKNDLDLLQIDVKSASFLQDLTIQNIVRSATATSEKALLKVDRESMTLSGLAKLSDASTRITWQEFFGASPKIRSDVRASGTITPALLRDLKLPLDSSLQGSATGTLHLIQETNKDMSITLNADLKNAALKLPDWNVSKAIGTAGTLSLDATFDTNGVVTLSNASLSWPDVSVSSAMARWNAAGSLESATLKEIKIGRTQGTLVVAPVNEKRISVVLSGPVIDLSGYWSQPPKQEAARTTPRYDVALRASRLFLDPNIPFSGVTAKLSKLGDDLISLDFQGKVEDARLSAIQKQNADGSRTLDIVGNETGKILQALDITDTVRGGALRLTGKSTPQTPQRIEGTIQLDKFTVVKAPVLAQLINALSPVGLLELLNNNGLNFDTLKSKIIFENPSLIRLREGRMAGTSLGLGFSGRVHRDTDTINLKGTLVPIEGLNKIASKIPLLGQILTGVKGEGILAATYTIKGPTNNPNVTVNPLSALAPGILRSIFFENNKDE